MKAKEKLYYMECHVAGRQYHEATEVWNELNIGTLLTLERELDNRYDADAVAIWYQRPKSEERFLLGYVPAEENIDIAKFLEMGYGDIFETRISRMDAQAHYEKQLHVVIKIKHKKK